MEASSDEAKELYARFGLAYYYAEVLHRGLCILYAFSRMPERGGMTRRGSSSISPTHSHRRWAA